MGLPKLYIETTIPSYLTARPSDDAIRRGMQVATRRWWDERRSGFELFVSELVEIEAARGEAKMAAERLEAIGVLPRLPLTESARELAAAILDTGLLPPSAAADATHIAVSAVHGMEILLTWNCTHIHNIAITRRIERVCSRAGFSLPMICTPLDLLQG
jgi:predicted nucleic acid-binding protein